MWDFCNSSQIFSLRHIMGRVFCSNVTKLQQVEGASYASNESHPMSGGSHPTSDAPRGAYWLSWLRSESGWRQAEAVAAGFGSEADR
jgi:hypothetical protein